MFALTASRFMHDHIGHGAQDTGCRAATDHSRRYCNVEKVSF